VTQVGPFEHPHHDSRGTKAYLYIALVGVDRRFDGRADPRSDGAEPTPRSSSVASSN
jgi:hypothetical protein